MTKRVQSLWVVPRERGRIYSSDVELTEADALRFAEPGDVAIEYVPRVVVKTSKRVRPIRGETTEKE